MRFNIPTDILRELCKFVGVLADDCVVRLNEENLLITQVDPAHVAMVVLRMPLFLLHMVEIESEDHVQRGTHLMEDRKHLDTDRLGCLLKHMPYQYLKLVWKEIEPGMTYDHLTITANDDESSFRSVWHEEHASDDTLPIVPNIPMPCEVTVNLGRIDEFLKVVTGMNMEISEDKHHHFKVKVTSEETDSELVLPNQVVGEEGEPRSLFPLDYIQNVIRAIKDHSPITIKFGTDIPMSMKGKTESGIEFQYLLAPRIEAD